VAGTALSADGSQLGSLDNMEAVVFGNDSITGTMQVADEETCGDFTHIFKRMWLIHNETLNDRPVRMIVGAQNNSGLTIGNDPKTTEYYNTLISSNKVSMIVAASPGDIESGNYKAVVPMTFINGEFQCSYTFSEEDTYITFGWRVNDGGCAGDENALFSGTKTFNWTQWTSRTNRSALAGLTIPSIPFGALDLGDNIQVLSTKITYPSGVVATTGYPRSVNIPARGSLEVRRRAGNVNQEVTLTVTFNHPVIPEFSISGLDRRYSSLEEVEVFGTCAGNDYIPTLSYASAPNNNTRYTINGNRATVKSGARSVSGTDKNGMVNVKFRGGVTSITIIYRPKVGATTVTQNIYISPITLRAVLPPPPVNEDGLAFTKQVMSRDITTCEPVEYSFLIQNTNCDAKYVHFRDTLPDGMKWEVESIGLDAVSSESNPALKVNNYGDSKVLEIDSLIVPGSTTLLLTATALFEADAPGGEYGNHASIAYERITNSNPVMQTLPSVDRETFEPNTTLNATLQERLQSVEMQATYSRQTYRAEDEISVTYTITNPNTPITDAYLNINFNDEFTYVDNSLQIVQTTDTATTFVPTLVTINPGSSLGIAGSADGEDGFTLLEGVMKITFRVKAPLLANIKPELDENGLPTENKIPLDIVYDLSSTMNDPCVATAIEGVQGNKLIPFLPGKTHVIVNKHITGKIVR
jgi:hypothetical protein